MVNCQLSLRYRCATEWLCRHSLLRGHTDVCGVVIDVPDRFCLQMFKEEACLPIDLELANWWSCTYPKARFTSQFFVARVVGQGG